jgi:hypothetical protein
LPKTPSLGPHAQDRFRIGEGNAELADTVEGLTDLPEILTAVIRAALADEALANGLKGRIAEMEDRLTRLQDRACKCRQMAKDVMIELGPKKLTALDFTASIRPGMPALMVIVPLKPRASTSSTRTAAAQESACVRGHMKVGIPADRGQRRTPQRRSMIQIQRVSEFIDGGGTGLF